MADQIPQDSPPHRSNPMTSELKPSPRARFRTKEREIEAVQFHGCGYYEARGLAYPEGVCFCDEGKVISDTPHAHVHTMHGQIVLLAVDDWISPEPDGSGFYPIKPSVFEARYEPARTPVPDKQLTDVVELHNDEAALSELHRLYNYADDDSRQFTRWQMVVAMNHGARLASLNTAPAGDDVRLPEHATEPMVEAGLIELGKWLGVRPDEIDDLVVGSVWIVMWRAALKATTHTDRSRSQTTEPGEG
jgi:hypothetical protein